MRSMTGFGRGQCEVLGRRFTVEIRSVNHRFVDLKIRLPYSDALVEAQLGQAVRKRIARGALSVTVRDDVTATAAQLTVDLPLARAYADAFARIAEACGLREGPSLAAIASQPGVVRSGEGTVDGEALWAALAPGVALALDDLIAARQREGEALRADLSARVTMLRQLSTEIARLAADAPSEARRRLEERLRKLLSTGEAPTAPQALAAAYPAAFQVDPQRLAQEVALLADRADITEEITRLGLHLDELDRLLADPEPAGRRLDFLIQELHREVNTIGSKAQRAEIAARVVDAKAEVERLREQVQNIE